VQIFVPMMHVFHVIAQI